MEFAKPSQTHPYELIVVLVKRLKKHVLSLPLDWQNGEDGVKIHRRLTNEIRVTILKLSQCHQEN